eukprot:3615183-Pleurochrysis_carterae.AAC.5
MPPCSAAACCKPPLMVLSIPTFGDAAWSSSSSDLADRQSCESWDRFGGAYFTGEHCNVDESLPKAPRFVMPTTRRGMTAGRKSEQTVWQRYLSRCALHAFSTLLLDNAQRSSMSESLLSVLCTGCRLDYSGKQPRRSPSPRSLSRVPRDGMQTRAMHRRHCRALDNPNAGSTVLRA